MGTVPVCEAAVARADRFLPSSVGGAAEHLVWRRRNRALIVSRTLVALVCVGLLSIEGSAGPLRVNGWLLWAVGLVGVLNLLFLALGRLPGWGPAVAAAQIAADLVLVEALVYLTGGAASVFVFLPFVVVLTAAVFLRGFSSLAYASVATILLAGVSALYSLARLGAMPLPLVSADWVAAAAPTLPRTLAMVAGQGIALHVVALLGGNVAARLRRETNLKEEILDTIGEGLIVTDANLRVVFVNSEAVHLLGFDTPGQLTGKRWDEIFRRRGDRQVRQMLAGGEHRSRVIEFDRRDLGKFYLSVKTSPFRRRHDVRGGVVAIIHDITAEKRMEEVQARAERLEEISLVAAGIAHELRNPLASIRGCVHELARMETARLAAEEPLSTAAASSPDRQATMESRQAQKVRRLAEIATAETDRLDKIISEFLDFARMRPPCPVPLDVHALVEEVVLLLRTGRSLERVEVETDVAGGLTLVADRDQLKQVLLNLARNAVDAMPEGGRLTLTAAAVPRLPGHGATPQPAPRVAATRRGAPDPGTGPISDMAAERAPSAVRIEVIDTGVGIGPEDRRHLFRPFFTTKPTGTGMGLSIVERIVRAHGGHVEVDSESGAGSTFRIWLPSSPSAAPALPVWQETG